MSEHAPHASSLLARLPRVRGKYRENADLSKTTWFQVGGAAEILFKPEDAEDLCAFMKDVPKDIPLTVIGVGSNLLVREGGIEGVVIRLGRGFAGVHVANGEVHAGAGALDANVAQAAADAGLSGLEFLIGIPGQIGGALAMNGGAYGREISDIIHGAEGVDAEGNLRWFTKEQLHYSYRHCRLLDHERIIFTRAVLRGTPGDAKNIRDAMEKITSERGATQPVRSSTGGSTFKNPEGHKAWQLIDAAGCRGLQIGGAQVSELHCNFLINTGEATAADLENLGEEVRARVLKHSGITLEWEIKRIGNYA